MSGHSKWHSIKHKKAAIDAKRGKMFTRFIKEITIAARMGGGDPESNARLRHAIDGAKTVNMPADNIKKAIMRGTGELEGVNYEENRYEGYGPGGVAIIVETLSDNKNRTVSEIRHTFSKYNGNLGESGSVGWMFSRKGLILIEKDAIAEDSLIEMALEAGAEDIRTEEDSYEVITAPDDLIKVNDAIKAAGVESFSSEVSMIPNNTIHLEGKQAEQTLKLLEKLEELDDSQYVWSNADIDEDTEDSEAD